MTAKLTGPDYTDAADILDCEVAVIQAVAEVESGGDGFLADGRCKILFEPHIFHRYTDGLFSLSHPALSYPKWKPGAYGPLSTQWPKFQQAYMLDAEAAIKSCSWGKFQLMGFNHKRCGFDNVYKFREAMERSERDQLFAFCRFVQSMGLADELQRKDWVSFARSYNGPGYARNAYDSKLAAAYRKHASRQ